MRGGEQEGRGAGGEGSRRRGVEVVGEERATYGASHSCIHTSSIEVASMCATMGQREREVGEDMAKEEPISAVCMENEGTPPHAQRNKACLSHDSSMTST